MNSDLCLQDLRFQLSFKPQYHSLSNVKNCFKNSSTGIIYIKLITSKLRIFKENRDHMSPTTTIKPLDC